MYVLVRWVYTSAGVLRAVALLVLPRTVTFRVTPKGIDGIRQLPVRLVAPFAAITTLDCLAAALTRAPDVFGYRLLSLGSGATFLVAAWLVSLLHAREAVLGGAEPRLAWRSIRGCTRLLSVLSAGFALAMLVTTLGR